MHKNAHKKYIIVFSKYTHGQDELSSFGHIMQRPSALEKSTGRNKKRMMAERQMDSITLAMGISLENLKDQVGSRLFWRKSMCLLRVDTNLMAYNHHHYYHKYL